MNEATHRIFFALWPDDGLRQQLKEILSPLLKKHPARRVPVHNWHITLAFLGNVSPENYACAQQRANDVKGSAFALSLDQFGFWPKPRVVWLGCTEVPEPLNNLVGLLNSVLHACAYTPERRAYAPHMTILRKATQGLDAAAIKPIGWRVTEFVLVESVTSKTGSVYEVIKRWPLG